MEKSEGLDSAVEGRDRMKHMLFGRVKMGIASVKALDFFQEILGGFGSDERNEVGIRLEHVVVAQGGPREQS